MMIYEVRDYCTALLDTKGELISQNVGGVSHFVADLGVLVTDGMQRYGARRLQAGRRHHHQPPGGRRPAPQQRRHLHALLLQGRAADVPDGARALDRRRRHLDRLRRRRRPSPIPWLEGLQLDQLKIYEAGKLDETLYRVIKDNIRFPESSLGDMKSQMAACRLGGAPARRAVRQIRPRHACSPRSTGSSTRPSGSAATWCAQLPDGVYEAERLDRRRRRASRAKPVPIHVKVTVKSRRHDHRPVRLLGRAQGRRSTRAPMPARASPTRR